MYLMKDAPRKTFERDQATTDLVAEIIRNVQTNGDRELLALTEKFDHVTMDTVRISEAQIRAAYTQVEPETIEAIRAAAAQIRFFAEKQLECLRPLTTACSGGTLSTSELRPHAGHSGQGRGCQDRCGMQSGLQGL